MQTSNALLLVTLAMLTAALWAVGLSIPRYDPIEPAVVVAFPDDPEAWSGLGSSAKIADGGIALDGDLPGTTQAFFTLPFSRPQGEVRLRVSGEVREGEMPEGSRGFSAVTLSFETADGEQVRFARLHMAPSRHRVSRLSKVTGWRPDATVARVGLTARHHGPALSLHGARVERVQPSTRYRWAARALGAAAVLWGIGLLLSMWRRGALPAVFGVGAVVAAAVFGAVASTRFLARFTDRWVTLADSVFGLSPQAALAIVFKGGHMLGFFVLALCLYRYRHALRVERGAVTGFIILFALATEGLQSHLSGRGASLQDVGIDLCGAAVAWCLSRRWPDQGTRSAASASERSLS